MTTLRLIALIAASACAGASADIYLIANSSLKLTADEAKEAFLGEKQLAGSVKLAPIDNGPAQVEFLQKVYGMSADRYNTVWAKKGFRDGLNAPAVKGGDLEVLGFVKSNPGGLGYVTAPPNGVTVIQKY